MSNQFSARSLLLAMGAVALGMLLVGYALRHQGDYLAMALLTSLSMLVVTFFLYALMWLALLPLGVIGALARESSEPAQSPFSTDRLPEQQIAPQDVEPSR
jgi:ABC-type branched-subunit amino acid transport system permease subunit